MLRCAVYGVYKDGYILYYYFVFVCVCDALENDTRQIFVGKYGLTVARTPWGRATSACDKNTKWILQWPDSWRRHQRVDGILTRIFFIQSPHNMSYACVLLVVVQQRRAHQERKKNALRRAWLSMSLMRLSPAQTDDSGSKNIYSTFER